MKKRLVSMTLAIAMAFSAVILPAAATDEPTPRYVACTHCDNPRAAIRTMKTKTGAESYDGLATCTMDPRRNCPTYKVQYVYEERCDKCNWLYSTSDPFTEIEMRHNHSFG